jgi:ComF family protein
MGLRRHAVVGRAGRPRCQQGLLMKLNSWLSNIQDWLLPRLCPACGMECEPGRDLCVGCAARLPRVVHACPRCAIPYEHPGTHGICGRCQRRPPAYTRTVALYRYAPPVDHLIRLLKFRHALGLAQLLGQGLAERLHDEPQRPDRILPVPLHRTRLRSRGYNQALELARPIARAFGIPLDVRSLQRVRATAAQSALPVEQRSRNVRGAFAVRADAGLRGLRLALVDDVMTTGSTVQAASRALRAAGASDVEVWVAARA